MVVLGDSIANGGANGWPVLVAKRLGLRLILRAQNGTGYNGGRARRPWTSRYGRRVGGIIRLKPDLVIVEGSRNDSVVDPETTRRSATIALSKLRAGLPNAKILVIGPIYSYPTNVGTTPTNEAIKAAATSLGLEYVDAVRAGWFTGSAHKLIGPDGVHPTDAGHRYLADLITPLVSEVIARN